MKNLIAGLIAMTMTVPVLAQVSGRESGGGAAFVCRDTHGKISEPSLLYDLYEAENYVGSAYKGIQRISLDPDQQIENLLRAWQAKGGMFASASVTTLRRALGLVKKDWKDIPSGTGQMLRPDFNPLVFPKKPGCKLESAAFYDDEKSLLTVDREIYESMSPTDQAALKIHEALYKVDRLLKGDKKSDRTRLQVAELFATGSISEMETINSITPYRPQLNKKGKPVSMKTAIRPEHMELYLGGKSFVCSDEKGQTVLSLKMEQIDRENIPGSSLALISSESFLLDWTAYENSQKFEVNYSYDAKKNIWSATLNIVSSMLGGDFMSLKNVSEKDLTKSEAFDGKVQFKDVIYNSVPERGIEIQNMKLNCAIQ